MFFCRNHIVVRVFCWFTALYILNFSVDAPDSQPDFKKEDLSINDMESITEIILEEWMEIEDAIPEHDESDSNDKTPALKKSFDSYYLDLTNRQAYIPNFLLKRKFSDYYKNFQQQFSPELTSPPPKA